NRVHPRLYRGSAREGSREAFTGETTGQVLSCEKDPRWMRDRHRARAERCRGGERSHPPWSPRPRNAHEGFWNGLNPAGYKLVRRAPHARKGLALDRELQLNQSQECFSREKYLRSLR